MLAAIKAFLGSTVHYKQHLSHEFTLARQRVSPPVPPRVGASSCLTEAHGGFAPSLIGWSLPEARLDKALAALCKRSCVRTLA